MIRYRIRMFGSRLVVLIARPDRPGGAVACPGSPLAPHGGGPERAHESGTRLTRALTRSVLEAANAPCGALLD